MFLPVKNFTICFQSFNLNEAIADASAMKIEKKTTFEVVH